MVFVSVTAVAFVGSYLLNEFWGNAGAIIGSVIVLLVIFIPFVMTDEHHPYEKNMKKAFIWMLVTYGLIAAFYAIGLLGNMMFAIDTKGIITALLGLAMVVAFDVVLFFGYLLIRAITNKNLTTK